MGTNDLDRQDRIKREDSSYRSTSLSSLTDERLIWQLFNEAKNQFKSGESDLLLLNNVKDLDNRLGVWAYDPLSDQDKILYLKYKAFICEVYDYFGCINESKEVCKEGEQIFRNLPDTVGKDAGPNRRQLIREQIRFCLGWANTVYYRSRQHHKAEEIVSKLRDLISEELTNNDFPNFGTKGQINYYLGRIYRQLGRWDDAEEHFAQAINNYHRRAEQKRIQFSDDMDRTSIELKYVQHRSAICLGLGIGWVNYTRGYLTRALNNNLIPARMLLLRTKDEINIASLDLIYGDIKRSLAKNKADIDEAIKTIEKAYEVFNIHGHRRYLSRAAYGLSMAYLQSGKLDSAQEALAEVIKIAEELNDIKWICKAGVLQSRIMYAKQDYMAAEKEALQAYQNADIDDLVTCKVDALIEVGRARIKLNNHDDARKDLEKSLDLNQHGSTINRSKKTTSPWIEALCHMNLAYSYALTHNGREAKKHYHLFQEIKSEVEDSRVHEESEIIDSEINKLNNDFVIRKIDLSDLHVPVHKGNFDIDAPGLQNKLNYKTHLRNLQKFLVDQAKELVDENQKVAKLLGISRQTLFQWEKDWEREKGDQ